MPKVINNCEIVSYLTQYYTEDVGFKPICIDYFYTQSICLSL